MAAMNSRRLSSTLLNPSHTPSLSSFSTNLIFNKPQDLSFEPFSHFHAHHSSSSSTFTFRRFSSSTAKPSCDFNLGSLRSYTGSTTDAFFLEKLTTFSMNPFVRRSSVAERTKFYSTNDSSSGAEKPQNPTNPYPRQNPEFKHQEIEGPTVERDLSSLASETREVMEGMTKTMYGLSKAVAVLGLIQLGLGAWITYIGRSSPITEVQFRAFWHLPSHSPCLLCCVNH